MSNFIVPNTFVPGTKAKAQEVNENFSAVQEELNSKAEKGGNISQQFLIASATENNHAVTKAQVDNLIQESADETKEELFKEVKPPLSIDSAYIDENGESFIINGESNILSFNVDDGTSYKPIIAVSAQGDSKIVITDLESIDVSSYTDGTYNVFANEESAYLLNNTILSQKIKPLNPSLNCIFENISKLPITFEKYNGTGWESFEDIFLGSIVVSSGVISKLNNVSFNNKWSKMPASELSTANSVKPAVIIENYRNGNSWYRIWSDGWCEQGGVSSVKAINADSGDNIYIQLLKQYADTSYSISLCEQQSGGRGSACVGFNGYTVNQINIGLQNFNTGAKANCWCIWSTRGYLPKGEY